MLDQVIAKSQVLFPRLDPGARYDQQKHTWTFTSGYKYQFGHCKNPDDWQMYFSNEYTLIMFDELVQFMKNQYLQIFGRLRTSDPVLRTMLKCRSMSNPTMDSTGMEGVATEDPMWVRTRFVDPHREGKKTLVRWVTLNSGERVKRTRIYLPARLRDNPDPDFVRTYEANLRDKPAHMQKALLEGDWYAVFGSFFGDEWITEIHTCRPFKIPDDWARFRSMDWGFKSHGVIHWWAMDFDGTLYCEREFTFRLKTATQVAQEAKEIEKKLGLWHGNRSRVTGPADTQLWEKRGSSAMSMADEFDVEGLPWLRADKTSRSRNAGLLLKRMKDHARRTQPPGIVFFDTCKMAIRTIPSVLADKNDPESPQDGGQDHWLDSALYGCAFASRGREGIPAKRTETKDYEMEDQEETAGTSFGYGEVF